MTRSVLPKLSSSWCTRLSWWKVLLVPATCLFNRRYGSNSAPMLWTLSFSRSATPFRIGNIPVPWSALSPPSVPPFYQDWMLSCLPSSIPNLPPGICSLFCWKYKICWKHKIALTVIGIFVVCFCLLFIYFVKFVACPSTAVSVLLLIVWSSLFLIVSLGFTIIVTVSHLKQDNDDGSGGDGCIALCVV